MSDISHFGMSDIWTILVCQISGPFWYVRYLDHFVQDVRYHLGLTDIMAILVWQTLWSFLYARQQGDLGMADNSCMLAYGRH